MTEVERNRKYHRWCQWNGKSGYQEWEQVWGPLYDLAFDDACKFILKFSSEELEDCLKKMQDSLEANPILEEAILERMDVLKAKQKIEQDNKMKKAIKNEELTSIELDYIAKNSSYETQLLVIKHPNVASNTLDWLAKYNFKNYYQSNNVKKLITLVPNTNDETLDWIAIHGSLELEKLYLSNGLFEPNNDNHVLKRLVCLHPNTNGETLDWLAKNGYEYLVAAHPNVKEETLKRIIRKGIYSDSVETFKLIATIC